ncbi:hypothetical protein [Psychrobacillus lasiicapitis]|uniref:hypothetical protein n=1 Tax=Psychrobacillus lasiicapitis TaxID=1636719 RepID=UPI0019952406|nr:hypothetical protein [Psychrobacillus lasiicapitis]GGA43163.1 hypothetical protein GCM10011384_36170 [Psychrobacillus lasiicapitis]
MLYFAWGDVPSKVKAKAHFNETRVIFDLLKEYELLDKTYVLKYKEYEQVLTQKGYLDIQVEIHQ